MHRPNICQIAQSLADAWSDEQDIASWVSYANQCAKWRRLAIACLDELSREMDGTTKRNPKEGTAEQQ